MQNLNRPIFVRFESVEIVTQQNAVNYIDTIGTVQVS